MTEAHAGFTFCRTLVDEWHLGGVRHAVVAPGSRSTPMAVALAEHPGIAVHVHHDERAAAFMALGLGLATGVPAVVLTTSGTAAVELHPAVVEAHQAAVPLLAVTADRPPELRGLGAPQTIDQRHLYGDAVRLYAEPGPPEWGQESGWRTIAVEALDGATGLRPGPVHLDLAFREPLLGPSGSLPRRDPGAARRHHPTWGPTDEQIASLVALTDRADGVIVAGARATTGPAAAAVVLQLAEELDWPVLCDHLSGCRLDHPRVVTAFDAILRSPRPGVTTPGVVIRLGGLLASRVTEEWLAASGAIQVGVDRVGLTPDPHGVLADSFWTAPEDMAGRLLAARRGRRGVPAGPDGPPASGPAWAAAEQRARAAIESSLAVAPGGEPAVAAAVARAARGGGELVVASSMPVRDLEWYGPPVPRARVWSNRGANGIDGVVSTAVGVALAGSPTIALVGDVAFLHDSTAMVGLAGRGVDLAVVVIDNDGGGIFSFLPQATLLAEARFEELFGTPHGADLVGLARSHHLEVEEAGDASEVAAALARWRREGGVRVVVVASDRRANVEHHGAIHAAVAAALVD